MNVFLYDPPSPPDEERRPWKKLLGSYEECIWDSLQASFCVNGRQIHEGIIVAHYSKLGPNRLTRAVIEQFCRNRASVTIIVITAGMPAWQSSLANLYFRIAPVGNAETDSFSAYFARFCDDFLENRRRLFSLLEPRSLDHVWALRILCEAWLLKNWPDHATHSELQTLRATLQIQGEKPELPEGIDLTPPSNRDEWLKPFREGGDTTDPLPAILDEISTDAEKTVAKNFFSKSKEAFAPTFDDVADLFLSLNATLKASS